MTYFDVQTTYTREMIRDWGRLTWRELPMARTLTWLIRALGGISLALAALWLALLRQPGQALVNAVPGAALLLVAQCLPWLNGWLGWAVLPKGRTENRFLFGEEGVTNRDAAGTKTWPYGKMRLLLETPGGFCVVLSWSRYFHLEKSGFAAGDPAGFPGFLLGRCPKLKYKSFDIQIGGTT